MRQQIKRAWGAARRAVLIAAVTAVAGVALYLVWFGYRPLHPGDELYTVAPGTSLGAFARDLQRRGILSDARTLVAWAYLKGHSRGLKAGEYRFEDGITALELLEQVTSGRVVSYPVTFIEGWTFRQVMAELAAAPKLGTELDGLSAAAIMARLGYPGMDPEGWVYPDTYHYTAGTTDAVILRRAIERMIGLLDNEWAERDPGLPLEDAYAALTLASIVEKETGVADERPLIAGVFINRLRRGMRLQTDPTVIYGLGEAFNGNLKLEHLQQDTPYNTYIRSGLPPTPIAMPGAAAIRAVLHPADTRALYFVSRGDGSHHFSETLRDHNRAVIKYQLGGRPRPFSSSPQPAEPTQ